MARPATRTTELLTIEEVAAELRLSVPALRARVHAHNAPPSVRMGRRRYWRASDVQKWLDEQFENAA